MHTSDWLLICRLSANMSREKSCKIDSVKNSSFNWKFSSEIGAIYITKQLVDKIESYMISKPAELSLS